MNGVCDRFCKGCIYCNGTSGDYNGSSCCTYYLVTDKRRPCPAGTGCTVKTLGKARGAWAEKMKKAREAKKVVRKVICKECGTEFETVSKLAIYCSKRCKDRVSQRNAYRRYLDGKAKSISSKTGSAKAEML